MPPFRIFFKEFFYGWNNLQQKVPPTLNRAREFGMARPQIQQNLFSRVKKKTQN